MSIGKTVIQGEVISAEGMGADVWTDDKQELCMILADHIGKRVEVTIQTIGTVSKELDEHNLMDTIKIIHRLQEETLKEYPDFVAMAIHNELQRRYEMFGKIQRRLDKQK